MGIQNINSGVKSLHLIDTTPGSTSAFAPPEDFSGGEKEYLDCMRVRYATDISATQEMFIVGKRLMNSANCSEPPSFFGPFAQQAKRIAQLCWSNRAAA